MVAEEEKIKYIWESFKKLYKEGHFGYVVL